MEVQYAAREAAEQAWTEQTSEAQAQLTTIEASIERIVAHYQARLEALNGELQAELEPFREPIDTLRHAIMEMSESFDPVLPDRPTPAMAEVDESDWLFDSQRDYLTQLSHYKARKAVSTDDAAD